MQIRVQNASFDNGFIKISANCSPVGLYWISTRPYFTWYMKLWYFKAICLVLGENFVPVSILIQYWFSSWTLQTKLGFETRSSNTSFIYSIIFIRGSPCIKSEDSTMYSDSAIIREISIRKELRQKIGQLEYIMTIPVHDITLSS